MNQTQEGSTVILPVNYPISIGARLNGGVVMKIFHPTQTKPYLYKFDNDFVKICRNKVAVIWEGELTDQGGFYASNH